MHLRGVGRELVGGLAQRLSAWSEAELTIAVEAVVICHRVHAGLEQHGLELLAGLVALRQGIDGKRGDGVECSLEDGARGEDHLGLAVVLIDGAGDLDGIPNFWVEAGSTCVDENSLRSLGWGALSRARGLDSETVEGLFALPHGGDDTLGGHVLALERGFSAGALNFRDGDGSARLNRVRIGLGVGGILARATGRLWRWCRVGEVCGVVVGVGAGCVALSGGRVAQAGGGGAFAYRRRAITHHVNLGPGGIVELDRALGAGHVQAALGIRSGQGLTGVAASALDEVVAASRDRPGQRGFSTGVTFGREILHGPARHINGGVRWVVELDEVIGEVGALVAAATVDLRDNGVGAVHRRTGLGDNNTGRDKGSDGE